MQSQISADRDAMLPYRRLAMITRAPAQPARRPAGHPAGAPRTQTYTPGQIIFLDGSKAEYFFEIISGTVRCCKVTEDGRRQIYRFAGRDEMLGLGGEQFHGYSAEAVTTVTLVRHKLSALDAAMARDERLRERVVQALRDELSAVRTQMMLLGRMSAAERIVSFLRDLSVRSRSDEGCIHLDMTRGDIADYLGLTLETVSRKMNMLKRMGLIEMACPSRVRIKNFDRLDAIAEAV